jgi:hypothetical protein
MAYSGVIRHRNPEMVPARDSKEDQREHSLHELKASRTPYQMGCPGALQNLSKAGDVHAVTKAARCPEVPQQAVTFPVGTADVAC